MSLLMMLGDTDSNPRTLFANNEQGAAYLPGDADGASESKRAWRRNLLLRSEELATSPWGTSNGATVAANTDTAPSGELKADSLFSGNGGAGSASVNQNLTLQAVTTHTFSFFVKAGTASTVSVGVLQSTFRDMTVTVVSGTATVSGTSLITLSNLTSNWTKISTTFTTSASTSATIYFYPETTSPGTGKSVVVTEVQLEQSSTPSEYQRITDFSSDFLAAFPTHTLYQDSTGVTPAVYPGDPVGLIIDSRKGGLSALGSDLVTNGTFAADSDWTKGANWTIGSGVATKTGGAANNLTQTIASTAGAWYRLTMDVTRTAGTLTVSLGTSGTTYAISASGTYTFMILAGSSTQTLTLAGDSSFAGTVDNVVARNVVGNHLYQPVSGSRGTLSREPDGGKRNLLTYTEQFDNAAWVKYRVSVTANQTTAPDGTITADKLIETAATDTHFTQQNATVTSGIAYTLTVYGKAAERNFLVIGESGGSARTATFDLSNGTVGNIGAGVSATITNAGSGWYRCSVVYTTASTTYSVLVGIRSASGAFVDTYLGDGTSGIYIWGAQLETGSSATNYQKVVSAYDCTEETSVGSGVYKRSVWAIDFDGSDDSYLTSSVDFSGTDKMTVWCGVWKRTSAVSIISELGTNIATQNGSFYLVSGSNPTDGWWSASRGDAVLSGTQAAGFDAASPDTAVLSSKHDISGDLTTIRRNAISGTSATGDKGAGNFANAVLYVGRRANASFAFSGRLYGLIIRGVQTTDAKVREFEKYTAKLVGRTI